MTIRNLAGYGSGSGSGSGSGFRFRHGAAWVAIVVAASLSAGCVTDGQPPGAAPAPEADPPVDEAEPPNSCITEVNAAVASCVAAWEDSPDQGPELEYCFWGGTYQNPAYRYDLHVTGNQVCGDLSEFDAAGSANYTFSLSGDVDIKGEGDEQTTTFTLSGGGCCDGSGCPETPIAVDHAVIVFLEGWTFSRCRAESPTPLCADPENDGKTVPCCHTRDSISGILSPPGPC